MKKIFSCFFFSAFFSASFSQQPDLFFKSSSKGPYIEHKVQPKEGLYPLSRMYNVHPRHIAAFNKQDYNKGLDIGQLMQIPLTDTNFSKTSDKGTPVYYTTIQKETLANVSVKTSKAPLGNIRKWNNLNDNNVDAGVKLIIGYLITNENQAKEIVNLENKADSPVVVAHETKSKVEEVKKPEEKKEIPVIKEEPKKVEPEEKKELTAEVKKEIVEEGDGFFKESFNQQVKQFPISKEQTVASSIFKTANGWQDTKYYVLISGVEPGTIVKITNPGNNKVLFAKVLYGMEGIRQNQGLDIRISDAAAAALSVSDTEKFIVKINY